MLHLSKQDVIDILKGCVILGTGGGGSIDEGMRLIEEAESLGKKFYMLNIDDIPDEAIIFTPYCLGVLSETPGEDLKQYEDLPHSDEEPILKAVTLMEKYLGKQMYACIACETGGYNTAIPLYVAAMKGGYILDADLAGRAVPEVQNSTFYIHNLPVSPITLANEFGEVAIYEHIKDDKRAESLLRAFSKVSKNKVSVVDHALEMKTLRHAIIPGTLSKALGLGRTYRIAKEKNINLAQEIAKVANGIVAFKGTIRSFKWENQNGFTLGEFLAQGYAENENDFLKVWFKNENLMSWLNDEVFVTLPDLICVIDTDTNEPVTNPHYRNGMNIEVVVYPAPVVFTTKKGLKAFGPRSFNFDIDYVPAIGRIQSIY